MTLGLILNYIRQNWFPISCTIAAFSLYFYIQWLQGNIEDLELDIVAKDVEIATGKQNIKDRNEIIEKWSKDTETRAAEMRSLKTDIAKLTYVNKKQINSIKMKKAPESCEETIEYFIHMGSQYE
jgi:hypothetical protein